MLNLFRVLITSTAVLLLLSCGAKDNSDPPAQLVDIDQSLSIDEFWVRDTRAGRATSSYNQQPLLIQDNVFVVDAAGRVKNIDPRTGKIIWRFETDLPAITGLAGNAEFIIASSKDGDLRRYRILDNGLKLQWSVNLKAEIRTTPVIASDQLFVRTSDGRLSALTLSDGGTQWTVSRRVPALSLTGNSRPLVAGNLVYSGFDDGRIVAYEREKGNVVWESTISQPAGRTEIERLVDIDGQFILKDGVLYVSTYQGRLAAIQAHDGVELWSRKFSSYQSIEADDEAIYLSDDKSHLWSVDRRTGNVFWMQDVLHARKITAPLIFNDKLIVADLSGYVHWFNKADGKLVGRSRAGDKRYFAQPLSWKNRVLVINGAGFLSALAPHKL